MWDISGKPDTQRSATARSTLRAQAATIDAVRSSTVPKGDPIPVAKVAAILAAKNTPEIIPYCHPLPITKVDVDFELSQDAILTTVTVTASYKTGVEMEALTAASVAALTLYDMLKQLDMGMRIESVELVEKTGGKSDYRRGTDDRL